MKKIMFNDRFCLTEAVLKGRKTMTRRIVPDGTPLGNWNETEKKLRYKVGEIIAVAQSYHELNKQGYLAPEWLDHTCESSAGYDNKMFVKAELMPHRIKITDAKIERLQDISPADAIQEGVEKWMDGYIVPGLMAHGGQHNECFDTPCLAFASLIDKLLGVGTWERNLWVVAYTFKLVY